MFKETHYLSVYYQVFMFWGEFAKLESCAWKWQTRRNERKWKKMRHLWDKAEAEVGAKLLVQSEILTENPPSSFTFDFFFFLTLLTLCRQGKICHKYVVFDVWCWTDVSLISRQWDEKKKHSESCNPWFLC